jgi:nucleoside-diphosphate-sugar epimerase
VKALVIGGPGFVGTATCKELMRRGVETVAASRTQHPYGTFTSHLAFDRADEDELARILAEAVPDVLVDLAAPGGDQVEAAIRNFKGGRYVLVSCGRGEGEAALARAPGLPWTVVRLPPVTGAGDPGGRVATILEKVERGEPVPVPAGSSRQPIGLAWVRDAGYAIALAADLRRPVDGKAFEAGFEGLTLEDLLVAIGRLLGKRPELEPSTSVEPWSPAADLGAARAHLGFEPSALEDCLAEVMAWYRASRPNRGPG